MSFERLLRNSVVAQFGAEIEAGKHAEFPRLRELWLEDVAARAEEIALRNACDEVAQNYRKWKD